MAGALKVRTIINCTGLGDEVTIDSSEVTMTVPVAYQEGYTVVDGQTTAIALFAMIDHIALAKIYGVYIKAEVQEIYIMVDTAGVATFLKAAADLVLNEGEACWLPINPSGNLGISIDGEDNTAAFSWMIVGSA